MGDKTARLFLRRSIDAIKCRNSRLAIYCRLYSAGPLSLHQDSDAFDKNTRWFYLLF